MKNFARSSLPSYTCIVSLSFILISSALSVQSDALAIINISGQANASKARNIVSSSRNLPALLPTRNSLDCVREGGLSSEFADPNGASFHDEFCRESANQVSLRGGNSAASSAITKTKLFVSKNFFLVGMVVAVLLAKLFPEVGKNGSFMRPELFIGNYGVTSIFLISGLSLKVKELTNALSNMKLNGLVQSITFGAWPLLGFGLTKGASLFFPNFLPQTLLDGILILTCLPTTVNMCIILTSASGGSLAAALCNAVLSNLAGIFITPALLLHFFGKSIKLPFVELVAKLCSKVLLPVAVGQMLRATPIKDFYSKYSNFFKRLQEIILLGIVWNAFCNAFVRGLGLALSHGAALLVILASLQIGSLALLFSFFRWKTLSLSLKDTIAATFCASHKTLAFGLPLINTIFEGNPNLASYCAPIMFMHPLQLIIGSLVVPYFRNFTGDDI